MTPRVACRWVFSFSLWSWGPENYQQIMVGLVLETAEFHVLPQIENSPSSGELALSLAACNCLPIFSAFQWKSVDATWAIFVFQGQFWTLKCIIFNAQRERAVKMRHDKAKTKDKKSMKGCKYVFFSNMEGKWDCFQFTLSGLPFGAGECYKYVVCFVSIGCRCQTSIDWAVRHGGIFIHWSFSWCSTLT